MSDSSPRCHVCKEDPECKNHVCEEERKKTKEHVCEEECKNIIKCLATQDDLRKDGMISDSRHQRCGHDVIVHRSVCGPSASRDEQLNFQVASKFGAPVKIQVKPSYLPSATDLDHLGKLLEYIGNKIVTAHHVTARGITWTHFDLYSGSSVVSDVGVIREGEVLQLRLPHELDLVSPSNWTKHQLDTLQIKFQDYSQQQFRQRLEKEFGIADMNHALADQLINELIGLSHSLISSYESHLQQLRCASDSPQPSLIEDADDNIESSTPSIPHLQSFTSSSSSSPPLSRQLLFHPLIKSIYMIHKYPRQESAVDSFVHLLLHYSGFNHEYLYVFPRHKLDLTIKDAQLESIAGFTLLDVCSFLRMAVVEDKSMANSMIISEPQMIGELVAMQQANKLKYEQTSSPKKRKVESSDNKLLAVRVNGTLFQFYFIEINDALMQSVMLGGGSLPPTYVPRSAELNFMLADDRAEILRILNLMQHIISQQGAKAVRRDSFSRKLK